MEVLKALNYAILNLSGKSVQLPGKKGSQTADPNKPDVKPAMLDYKAIPGRVVDGGYEIPAAPKKDKVEEINNLNENKIMVDNFTRFHPKPEEIFMSDPQEEPDFIKPYFNLRMFPVWHIGSNYLSLIAVAWYQYLLSKGVNFMWNTEVEDINFETNEIEYKSVKK